jgi:hypothetical protein
VSFFISYTCTGYNYCVCPTGYHIIGGGVECVGSDPWVTIFRNCHNAPYNGWLGECQDDSTAYHPNITILCGKY